jgi:hypothetical protein
MKVISRMSPPQFGHSSGNSSPRSFAQAIREVSCERGFAGVSQQPSAACPPTACPSVAASRRLPIAGCSAALELELTGTGVTVADWIKATATTLAGGLPSETSPFSFGLRVTA